MKGKKWALGVMVVLAVSIGAVMYQAPEIARSYVKDNHPGVDPQGDIVIDWTSRELTFHQVVVKRDGISAKLDEVHVNNHKEVTIHGGTVNVTLGDDVPESSTSVPKSGTTITADGLTVNVTRGDLKATLTNTSVDSKEVCFAKAEVDHPKATVTASDGCVQRDKSFATARVVSVPVELPFAIPRVGKTQTVQAFEVSVETLDQLVRFDRIEIGKFKIDRGTVKMGDENVYVDTKAIKVDHPWVAPHPVRFNDISLVVPRSIKDEGVIRAQIGKAGVRIDPHSQAIEGDEPCSEWFDALPHPLPEVMAGMADNFKGQLTFNVRAKPTPLLEIENTCKFTCSAPPIKGLVGKRFTYFVYDKDNNLVERTTGPGAKGWVPFRALPEFIPEAFRLMEDPGFLVHNGISRMALQNSLVANLESGRFVKGGSTITMQLAKNLWLRRHKTIGRKAQEALLTMALESCLSKQQIMELYVNVVEFGPDLYGIGPASDHYFRKYPASLAPDEGFYLASLLPSPRTALPPHSGGIAKAQKLMERLANSGFIGVALAVKDAELYDDSGTAGWVVAP